jgi:hypothetical protein
MSLLTLLKRMVKMADDNTQTVDENTAAPAPEATTAPTEAPAPEATTAPTEAPAPEATTDDSNATDSDVTEEVSVNDQVVALLQQAIDLLEGNQ